MKEWAEDHIKLLENDLARTFRDNKNRLIGDQGVGSWLKKACRDGIAHGYLDNANFLRDPNNYNDWEEIKWANEIMQELSEKLIVEKLSVPHH